MNAHKLVLGGAQFGMAYGVTNADGAPGEEEITGILNAAHEEGIDLIDTAPAYGDSEAVLGRLTAGRRFDFVTKTLAAGGAPNVDLMEKQFYCSLERLGQQEIYGLLFHDADILTSSKGAEFFQAALRLKANGHVRNLGVSVYDTGQIDRVLSRYKIDIIQLPINLLDKRLVVSGALERLKNHGAEIHARSAFLQGVLLSNPDALPEKVSVLRPQIQRLRGRLAELKISPMEACLGSLQSMDSIDRIVVGVTSQAELREILGASAANVDMSAFEDIAGEDEAVLDPRNWH